ncbi:MAG: hypothetical protein IEMM0006_1017 [bacterium]|nr:MAG: hypothetical protein IEMM0006_1017 [bacterium]
MAIFLLCENNIKIRLKEIVRGLSVSGMIGIIFTGITRPSLWLPANRTGKRGAIVLVWIYITSFAISLGPLG